MLPRRFYFDNTIDQLFETENLKMKCDIYEKDNTYHIEMDLPGFSKKEISIECDKGNLVITAEKEEKTNEEDLEKNYLRKERIYGKYSRSFYLGDMKEEEITAKFEDGTLHISIPKMNENENKKLIDIQ